MNKNFKRILAGILSATLLLGSVEFSSIVNNKFIAATKNDKSLENFMDEVSSLYEENDLSSMAPDITFSKESENTIVIDDTIMVPVEVLTDNTDISYSDIKEDIVEQDNEELVAVEDVAKNTDYEAIKNDDESITLSKIYQSKTLIVKSPVQIDTYDAENVISGYGNLYILKYATEEDTKDAYDKFLKNKNIDSVEIDSLICAETSETFTEETIEESVEETTETSTEEITEESSEGITETSETTESSEDTSTSEEITETLSETENIEELSSESTEETTTEQETETINIPDGVIVAVLDSGIDKSNLLFDGHIVDLGLNLSTSGEGIQDDNGHGTAVASIIAKNSDAYLMPIKIANSDGKGTALSLYLAIQAAIENEADIINVSLTTSSSDLLTSIVHEATEKGIVVIAAAGNQSTNVENYAPANIEDVIAVAATDKEYNPASYSNYGSMIDYAAIGTDVEVQTLDGTELMSGTSLSAAYVSAVMAYAKENDKSFNDYVYAANDASDYYGKGIVSLEEIEKIPEFTPDVPEVPEDADWIFITEDGTIYNKDSINLEAAYAKDGITYTYSRGTLTLTGSGTVTKAWQTYNTKWEGYVSKVKTVKINSANITGVNNDAFSGCTSLATVTLSAYNNGDFNSQCFKEITTITKLNLSGNITKIGSDAFYGCTGLKNIGYSTSNEDGSTTWHQTFRSVTEIGSNAFYGCTSLVTLKTGSNVSSIGDYAFYNCTNLATATLGEKVSTLYANTFKGTTPLTTLTINSNISAHNNAFKGHKGIKTLEFGSKCTTIYESMFEGCTGIKSLDMRTSINTVGEKAFMGCTGLTDFGSTTESSGGQVKYPNYATSVGKYAFRFYGNTNDSAQVPTATVSQSVSWYDKKNGIGKVTLNVSATTPSISTAKDYIVIIDTSGSMSEKVTLADGTTKTRMEIAKNSLNLLIDKLAAEGSNNRICIITQGQYRSLVFMHWKTVTSSNAAEIKSYITNNMKNDNNKGTATWGESARGNSKRMWLNNPDNDLHVQSNYSVGMKLALRAIQSKGTNNNTYAMVIGDFEATDGNIYTKNKEGGVDKKDASATTKKRIMTAFGQDLAGAVEDVWTITTACKGEPYASYAKLVATGTDKYTDVPNGSNFNSLLDAAVTHVVDASLICARNAIIKETLNTKYWDVYNPNGLTNNNGILSKSGLSLDKNQKTYSYLIKLKEDYKYTTANYQVSNNIRVDYTIYGGLSNGKNGYALNTTNHTLDWQANTYALTLNPNGGTYNNTTGTSTKTMTYASSNNNGIGIPSRTGHVFKGWYTATSGGIPVFDTNGYAIQYNKNTTYWTGGSGWSSGWMGGSYCDWYNMKWNYANNLTLYAQWESIKYTVTYNGNGATGGSTASQTFNHGSSVNISANGFTRTGYEFIGWEDGFGKPYDIGVSYGTNANLTLYAQWRLITTDEAVHITWDDSDNNVEDIPTGVRPSKVTVNLTAEGHPELNQTVTVTGNNSVPATSNEWTYSFNGLQKYDTTTGAEIKYSVTENQPVCLDGSLKYNILPGSDAWHITNKLKVKEPEPDKKYGLTVEGTVTWKDENDKYHFRPDKVYVDLYRNDTLYDTVELPEGTTTYEFTGLDKIGDNFKANKYTIVERNIDNYEIKYDVYSTSSSVTAETGDVIVTTTLHSDITNTFTPDRDFVDRFGNNVLSMQAAYTDKNGNVPDAEDIKGSKLLATLKQLTTIWKPVDAENGVYTETYGSYSGNEINLIVDETVTVKNIPYGKYEIAVQNNDNLTLKDIEELASRNAVFSYENDKYYVTYSYEYEEAKEDLNVNMVINTWKGYTSKYSVQNFFKPKMSELMKLLVNNYVAMTLFMEEEHSWDSSFTVDKEPTCTEDGIKSIHCKDCTLVKDITIIKALGHDIKNGKCTRCGRPIAQEVLHIYYDNDVEDTNEYHSGDEAEILPLDKDNFIGWSTKRNAEEAEYMAGDTITIADEDIKLYAVFEEPSTEEESSEQESSTEQETSEAEESSESQSSIVEESSTEQDFEIEEISEEN